MLDENTLAIIQKGIGQTGSLIAEDQRKRFWGFLRHFTQKAFSFQHKRVNFMIRELPVVILKRIEKGKADMK